MPRPPGHPFVHFLLLVGCAAASAQSFFPTPGYQIGFLGYVLVLGYFYPLLLRWLRPRTGFLFGLILLLLIAGLSEAVGIIAFEYQNTGLVFANGVQDDVLLSPVVLISFAGVVLSALATYLLGWSMLKICTRIFGKVASHKARPVPAPVAKVMTETQAQPFAEAFLPAVEHKPVPSAFKFE